MSLVQLRPILGDSTFFQLIHLTILCMKKTLCVLTLLAVAAGSWAFYPKAVEPQGYMMVVSRLTVYGTSAKNTVTTIAPDGQLQTVEVEAKTGSMSKIVTTYDQLHQLELKKLNELRQAGWHVVNTARSDEGGFNEVTFLLDK